MTKEEAYDRIDAIIAKHEIDDEFVSITNSKDYDALRMARKILEQEPIDDAISRNAIKSIIDQELLRIEDFASIENNEGRWREEEMYQYAIDTIEKIREWLLALPSIQPKTGHWVKKSQYGNDYCSKCDYELLMRGKPKFCPNCGTKMESEDKK